MIVFDVNETLSDLGPLGRRFKEVGVGYLVRRTRKKPPAAKPKKDERTVPSVPLKVHARYGQAHVGVKGDPVGGRNQWRVERVKLEEFIAEAYERTRQQLDQLPDDPPAE